MNFFSTLKKVFDTLAAQISPTKIDIVAGDFSINPLVLKNGQRFLIGTPGAVGGTFYAEGCEVEVKNGQFVMLGHNLFNSSGGIEADVLNRSGTYATLRNFVPGQAQLVKVTDKGYAVLGDGVRTVYELAKDPATMIGWETIIYNATGSDQSNPTITTSYGASCPVLVIATSCRAFITIQGGIEATDAPGSGAGYAIINDYALNEDGSTKPYFNAAPYRETWPPFSELRLSLLSVVRGVAGPVGYIIRFHLHAGGGPYLIAAQNFNVATVLEDIPYRTYWVKDVAAHIKDPAGPSPVPTASLTPSYTINPRTPSNELKISEFTAIIAAGPQTGTAITTGFWLDAGDDT